MDRFLPARRRQLYVDVAAKSFRKLGRYVLGQLVLLTALAAVVDIVLHDVIFPSREREDDCAPGNATDGV